MLALRASGRSTGIVIDLGHDTTRIVPVFEGYVLPHAVECLYLGGRDMT